MVDHQRSRRASAVVDGVAVAHLVGVDRRSRKQAVVVAELQSGAEVGLGQFLVAVAFLIGGGGGAGGALVTRAVAVGVEGVRNIVGSLRE